MASEDNRWREKYRQSVNQQEQLEKTLTAQQALLHRTVLALSSAAEGHDTEIDKRLSAIRSSLKSNDVGGFGRMIKSLERVIVDADKKRLKQWKDIYASFINIANHLQSNTEDDNAKSSIKAYKKRIPKGELLPATLKRLLDELHQLQDQAKNTKPKSKTGLMSRLFNKDTSSEQPYREQEITTAQWEEVEESNTHKIDEAAEHSAPIAHIEGEILETKYRERQIPEQLNSNNPQESFATISDRVTIILMELLDHFPAVDCVEQKAIKIKQSIHRGLSWRELAPTLEDIRDFVIQSSIGADDNYRNYLNHVYEELSAITHILGIAIQEEEQQRLANTALQNSVDSGMRTLSHALTEHNDIDQLKMAVESQVHTIQDALKHSKEKQSEGQESLSSQLTALIERVHKMEQQDASTRQQLEEEKKRAVTDTLTGLPNREAYSERVHNEMLRWQRYQHPLSLAVLDIDYFKKVNDQYGHQMGDKVLKAVSTSVANRLREVDFIARFGGEEFVLLLPETRAEDALSMLDRTRERLAKTHMRSQKGEEETKFTVTVSIGIAEFKEGDTADDVFERADNALYQAKEQGRNQCIIEGPSD